MKRTPQVYVQLHADCIFTGGPLRRLSRGSGGPPRRYSVYFLCFSVVLYIISIYLSLFKTEDPLFINNESGGLLLLLLLLPLRRALLLFLWFLLSPFIV